MSEPLLVDTPKSELPLLYMDVDGCLRPTGNYMAQLDGELQEVPEGHTRITVEHVPPKGMKVRPRFVRSDGTPDTRPFKPVFEDTFDMPNHIIEFMRCASLYFDCRFASWWFPGSSTALCEAVGIEPWDNSRHPSDFMQGGNYDDYKWNFVRETYEGRPFAWVDDAELLRRHHDWALGLDVPTLCITPDHTTGLTPEQVDRLKAFGLDNRSALC